MPDSSSTMDSNQSKSSTRTFTLLEGVKAFTSFIKAIAWPFVVLLLFFCLRHPLTIAADAIGERMTKVTKFTAGKFSFEVERAAKASGAPELGKLIGDLSSDAITELLTISNSTWVYAGEASDAETIVLPEVSDERVLEELAKSGLLKFAEDHEKYKRFLASLSLVPTYGPKELRYFRVPTTLTREQLTHLKKQEYSLTDKGLKAFGLIVRAVKNSLKGEERSEQSERGND